MKNLPEARRGLYDAEGKLKPVSDRLFESDFELVLSALAREIQQFRLTSPKQLVALFETRGLLERFFDVLEFNRGHLERDSAWHVAFVQLARTRTGYAAALRKAALS